MGVSYQSPQLYDTIERDVPRLLEANCYSGEVGVQDPDMPKQYRRRHRTQKSSCLFGKVNRGEYNGYVQRS